MPTNRASMAQKKINRKAALPAYIGSNGIVVLPSGAMGELASRFSSFANTLQTRMNSSNGTASALGGTLEAQVDRALSQTLRQPGGTATMTGLQRTDSAIGSLVGGGGGIQPTMSPYQAALLREARITQADLLGVLDTLQPLSPFTDPGDVSSLQALVRAEVNALLDEFSYTRLLPRQQRVRVLLGGLLGWDYDSYVVADNISSPFSANAPAGDIQAFASLLNLGAALIPTIQVEDQLASQLVLATDAALFDTQWSNFWNSALSSTLNNIPVPFGWTLWEPGVTSAPEGGPIPGGLGKLGPGPAAASLLALGPQSPHLPLQAPWQIVASLQTSPTSFQSYAEKMIQADLLLPVIAQDAGQVESSLEAIGYSAGEQETNFVEFWSAVDADLLSPFPDVIAGVPAPPLSPGWTVLNGLVPAGGSVANPALTPIPVYMTVADIIDWTRSLVGPGGSDLLRQAGALGLNLLCDQADELFWLALAMLDPTASQQVPELGDPEVQLQVVSLASDLNSFANLAY